MSYSLNFLGTGTSHGIPVIGCKCATCTSTNPKNKRYRSSVLFTKDGKNLLIDTTPEFRLQALRANLNELEGVLYTHIHADHVHGIDDLRVFTTKTSLPIYGSEATIKHIEKHFTYVIKSETAYKKAAVPHLYTNVLEAYKTYNIGGFEVTPLIIYHGDMPIFGYRIFNVAYLTDTNNIPEKTLEYLKDLDLLVLVALQHKEHKTHYNISQAVAMAKRIGAKQTLFTHIAHGLEHEKDNADLPPTMALAYDTLEMNFEE
ncbi:MAG: MBL fold metallo-hydrolase [Sphaerochaetaceae bacterium]